VAAAETDVLEARPLRPPADRRLATLLAAEA
jgi:hypothetical protein